METIYDKTETFIIGDVEKCESSGYFGNAVHYYGSGEHDFNPANESWWPTKKQAIAAVRKYHKENNTGPHNFNINNKSLY